MSCRDDLIFDIGLHQGEDTSFYLAKGYSVVAVEANPTLCEQAREQFADHIAAGRLTVVHSAIAATEGPVTFYANEHSEWGTADSAWAERNARQFNAQVVETLTVPGVTLDSLLQQHGVPYYMKIDIEGADLICLQALRGSASRPRFVSIESDKRSWRALRFEFDLLGELGYQRFKVVNQAKVRQQTPPQPAREGQYVDFRFPIHSSGMFGDEAPGEWLTRQRALLRYAGIYLRYWLYGDFGVLPAGSGRAGIPRRALRKLLGGPDWYDTHARR